jgi:hypothetical protein
MLFSRIARLASNTVSSGAFYISRKPVGGMGMRGFCLWFAVLLVGIAADVHATTVSYLADNISGNRWQYTYTVSNDTPLASLNEFTVYFNSSLYANLDVGITTPGWDALVVQSDTILGTPMDGFYDVYSAAGLSPGGGVSGFKVAFDWLGATGGPGSQSFEIVDPNDFSLIDSGATTLFLNLPNAEPVPEPGTVLLIAVGFAGIAWKRRKG